MTEQQESPFTSKDIVILLLLANLCLLFLMLMFVQDYEQDAKSLLSQGIIIDYTYFSRAIIVLILMNIIEIGLICAKPKIPCIGTLEGSV